MSCSQVQMTSPSLFPSPDPYRHRRYAKLYNKEDLRIVLGGYLYTNQHPTLIDFDPSQLDVGNGPSTDRSHRARGYGPGKREARAS